jgi:hypothetical protein
MSSKEDIERIRKIRTLEPVHNAWEKWKRERKVRLSFMVIYFMKCTP